MNSKVPSAGSLDDEPLYQLLIHALDHRLDGSLVLETKTGDKTALTFANGQAVKMKTASPVARLGTVCVGRGLINPVQLERVLDTSRSGLLGQQLVAAGLVEPAQLAQALSEQLEQQIEWASKLPNGTVYGFYPNRDFLQNWGGGPRDLDPLRAIWSAMRTSNLPRRLVDSALASVPDAELRLHPNSRVARFGFTQKERAVVDVLRAKPQPVDALINCGVLPLMDARRLIVCLVLTRHVDLGVNMPPLGVVSTQVRSTTERPRDLLERASSLAAFQRTTLPAEDEGELDQRRVDIRAEAEVLLEADYYGLLGVAKTANPAALQTAFLGRAKEWHPDKLDPELSDMKELVTKVFSRMTEAHQVLTQPERRAEYDRVIEGGTASQDEHAEVQRVLRAAAAFQKAEILVKRREWQQAIETARKAHEGDPDQAEYEALYVWLLARQIQGGDKASFREFVDRLSRAVKKQSNNVKVRLYRARVLKDAGMVNDAMRDFRAIVEQDPNHVEAQRELRLHRMRNGPTGDETTGLLGRLFKKS